nr:hypothetical protein [uncultured Sphingorhabdus sp.]
MKPTHRIPAQLPRRIFTVPFVLAFATVAGLILGLTGDGLRDGIACLLLFLPLAIFAARWLQRS